MDGTRIGIIALTGYVGLATMTGALVAAAYVGATGLPDVLGLFAFTVATAALIVYTHRGNIKRMRDGTEVRMGMLRRAR